MSLANNHGADYGAAGLRDTLRVARNSPVAVIGVGRDPDQAFRPYQTSVTASRWPCSPPTHHRWRARPRSGMSHTGPGLARADARLLAAVRAANARSDVVAVYLHWGAENRGCPTAGQRKLARSLADAGADVVVGTHAHVLLGAGMLDDTYVSYGLGNFLWYHGSTAGHGSAPRADRGRRGRSRRLGTRQDRANGRSAPARDRIGTPRRDPGMAQPARLHRPRAGTGRKGFG